MLNEIRNSILLELHNSFTVEQLKQIDLAVAKAMIGYDVKKQETLPSPTQVVMQTELIEFLIRKEMKGCSKGTIQRYKELLVNFSMWINKDLKEVTDIDVLAYLHYRENCLWHGKLISKRTIDGQRRILSSFYTYLHDTGKISKNPLKTVEPIKYKAAIRKPLNDIELELARNACVTVREKAIFEVLYASGGRVSEIVSINHTDIDFDKRRILVVGKGNKERYIYLNAKAILAIKNYMCSRDDDNDALFVASRKPHQRLKKNSIENEVRRIGQRSGIGRKLFPHLLRHTFATNALMRGVKIEEVSKMLGHESMDTTRIYAKISDDDVRYTYKKYYVG